jgi:hypothetical protein
MTFSNIYICKLLHDKYLLGYGPFEPIEWGIDGFKNYIYFQIPFTKYNLFFGVLS